MNDSKDYLYANEAEKLQIPYEDYLALRDELEKADHLKQISKSVAADLQAFLDRGTLVTAEQPAEHQTVPDSESAVHMDETENATPAPEITETAQESDTMETASECEAAENSPEYEAMENEPEPETMETAPECETAENSPEYEAMENEPEPETMETAPECEAAERSPEYEAMENEPEPETMETAPECETAERSPAYEAGENEPEHQTVENEPEPEVMETTQECETPENPQAPEQAEPSSQESVKAVRTDIGEVPPVKNEIAEHFNQRDESGRLFNIFKQYYTCLNEMCGGTVRVTMKDGFCSLWNYDEWEEFAWVDIYEEQLRIAIDPRYTDLLKSLCLCEAPRLISTRRNVICVKVGDLNNTVLDVLAKAFNDVGIQVG